MGKRLLPTPRQRQAKEHTHTHTTCRFSAALESIVLQATGHKTAQNNILKNNNNIFFQDPPHRNHRTSPNATNRGCFVSWCERIYIISDTEHRNTRSIQHPPQVDGTKEGGKKRERANNTDTHQSLTDGLFKKKKKTPKTRGKKNSKFSTYLY